jgi:hypothetical protein
VGVDRGSAFACLVRSSSPWRRGRSRAGRGTTRTACPSAGSATPPAWRAPSSPSSTVRGHLLGCDLDPNIYPHVLSLFSGGYMPLRQSRPPQSDSHAKCSANWVGRAEPQLPDPHAHIVKPPRARGLTSTRPCAARRAQHPGGGRRCLLGRALQAPAARPRPRCAYVPSTSSRSESSVSLSRVSMSFSGSCCRSRPRLREHGRGGHAHARGEGWLTALSVSRAAQLKDAMPLVHGAPSPALPSPCSRSRVPSTPLTALSATGRLAV